MTNPLKKINAYRYSCELVILLLIFFLAGNSLAVSPVVVSESAVLDTASTDQVKAQLVASTPAVYPGEEIYVGLHQKIIPHWHTYWKNPGDSGSATTIEWTLPQGATASDIIWPTPQRFSMGPITNYAYDNEVTLLTKMTVPSNLQPGESFSIQALVDWLVCEEECIPQQVKLALSLPVVASGVDIGDGSSKITEALARLPVKSPFTIVAFQGSVEVATGRGELIIQVHLPEAQIAQVKDIWFYPYDWGRIQQSVEQSRKIVDKGIELTIKTGDAPLKMGERLTGVLVITEQTPDANSSTITRGFDVNVPLDNFNASNPTQKMGFFAALLFALLGGIILNLMPCVFPVLSIKALSLVSHADLSAQQIRLQGWAYTFGVLISFGLLALLLILLKAGGVHIGWGFQFQSPVFVLALAYLMFAVGLSLSGVFYIGGAAVGVGSSLAEKSGYSGSFFTGVLATVVATPCTAPFMAAALGYALTQPAVKLWAIFLSLGMGLALPYLLLAHWPRLQHWLPRPGLWMERMKQFLAFPMYAAAIWLVWVLVQQVGTNAVVIALSGMLIIAFAAWLYNTTLTATDTARKLGTISALLLFLFSLIIGYQSISANTTNAVTKNVKKEEQYWEAYSDTRLKELLAQGKPVFLNFTAAWCISCLVNERVALSDVKVKEVFKQQGITYLKGDWTNRDREITQFLKTFNRSGVPLYVFYPAGRSNEPKELPQILTPDIVISAVTETIKND